MYKLEFSKSAVKTLRRMPRNDAARMRAKLNELVKDPYAPNNNVAKLQNRPGYRLRVGDWRVISHIDDETIVVLIVKIGPRGEVYR